MKYLLHGKDDFSIRERLVVMKEAVGIPDVRDVNIAVLDGTQAVSYTHLRAHET